MNTLSQLISQHDIMHVSELLNTCL